jgi:DNA-binding CsgD family transcriptional regulator
MAVTRIWAVRNNLSQYEYKVWSLYVSGKTAKDIGKIVGVDEKSVNNAIYRIRKKLRERLE